MAFTQENLDQIDDVIKNWSTSSEALKGTIDYKNGGSCTFRDLSELETIREVVYQAIRKESNLDLGVADASPYRILAIERCSY